MPTSPKNELIQIKNIESRTLKINSFLEKQDQKLFLLFKVKNAYARNLI